MGLLYLGNALFRKHFYDRVIYPCANPDKFHPDHLPMQRTFAIYGQKGNQKQAVVAQLLLEADVPFLTLSVSFAMTLNFCDSFQQMAAEHGATKNHPARAGKVYAVIIDHADILVNEPDDKSVTLLTTQLTSLAEEANLFIIALFDRHQRGEPNPYKDAFFAQFPYVSVLSSAAEDKGFLVDFYKRKFDSDCAHYKIQNTLQEHEYQMLADVSVYATVDDLNRFCQAVMYELVQTEAMALVYETHIAKRFRISGGFEHIDTIMYQMSKMVDEQFTSLIGIMPKQVGVKKVKREREEEEGGGLEEAKKELKIMDDDVNAEEVKEEEEVKLKFE